MAWLKRLFSPTINRLSQEIIDLTKALAIEESKVQKLERQLEIKDTQLEKIRTANQKILLQYGDQMSKIAKIDGSFVKAVIDPPTPQEEQPDLLYEQEVLAYAQDLRQQDAEAGVKNLQSLQYYIDRIKEEGLDALTIG